MKQVAALSLLLLAGTSFSQQAHQANGIPVRITDLRGTPIWQAHVYVRRILPEPNDPMQYVGDADRDGRLVLPPDAFARDVLVFDYGFQPWVGSLRGAAATSTLTVRMHRAPCGSADGGCRNDADAPVPARPKRR